MSNPYTARCGCVTPCAITKEQRRYAKRSLTMAYSMRDFNAVAKIKDALRGCPSMYRSNGQASAALSKTAEAIITWAESNGAKVVR